jgi:MFS family permease
MDRFGWHGSLGGVALLLVLCTLPVWRFDEKRLIPHQGGAAETAFGPRLLLAHYRGLLAEPGMFAWLAVVLAFKLGDALGSPMIKPMLVDQGWTNAMLGQLTLISSAAGIGGAVLGGTLYAKLGAHRSLFLFGLLQALGIAAMALLVDHGGSVGMVYAVALAEQIADGMSTVALFAVMMRRCRAEHEGADFTLQASAQVLLAGLVGATSGVLAKAVGFVPLFLMAGTLGVAALALLRFGIPLRERGVPAA